MGFEQIYFRIIRWKLAAAAPRTFMVDPSTNSHLGLIDAKISKLDSLKWIDMFESCTKRPKNICMLRAVFGADVFRSQNKHAVGNVPR